MRAYIAQLRTRTAIMLAIPLLAVAYPVVTILLPALIRAVVPNVVRTVLTLM